MMPGLVHNSLSAASASSSKAAERRPFPKPFIDRSINNAVLGDSAALVPSSSNAFHVIHTPALQAMKPQVRRFNPATDAPTSAIMCGARLISGTERSLSQCDSSGSNHEPSSVCLAAMVNEFIEDDSCSCVGGTCTPACRTDSTCSTSGSLVDAYAESSSLMQNLACCRDYEEHKLLNDVQAIVEANWSGHLCVEEEKSSLRRSVMSALRMQGYEAAVCKTRWDHSGGIPGGDYEYLDVLFPTSCMAASPSLRLLVDIEFQAQFEIARPSSEFSALLRLVPPIFVGKLERLQQMVHLMAEATKHSLRIGGLHLPPWRKLSYMKAKWFSSYKRTSKHFPNSASRKPSARDGEFAGIAKRRNGLDSRCTNELELLYSVDGLLMHSNKKQSNVITVTSTDWQFPALETRSPLNLSRRPSEKVMGLASMFIQAGTLASNTIVARAA